MRSGRIPLVHVQTQLRVKALMHVFAAKDRAMRSGEAASVATGGSGCHFDAVSRRLDITRYGLDLTDTRECRIILHDVPSPC